MPQLTLAIYSFSFDSSLKTSRRPSSLISIEFQFQHSEMNWQQLEPSLLPKYFCPIFAHFEIVLHVLCHFPLQMLNYGKNSNHIISVSIEMQAVNMFTH